MSATARTCIRDEALERVVPDPTCPAPVHAPEVIPC